MPDPSTLATTALLVLLPLLTFSYAISGFVRLLFRQQLSPLRDLRGPPVPSFFMGNLMEMHDQENTNLIGEWEARYGSTFTYRGFIGGCRLMTTDPAAIAYVLGHAYDYPKPDFVRDSLATMAAGHDGLLTVEGDVHKRQRKILTPAFSSSHIKSLHPIFWQKAIQLRDTWLKMAQETPAPRVDALSWLSRATLDIIGLAGFGYTFNSLANEDNELANAFSVIFSTARKFRVMTILQVWFPFLRKFRRNTDTMNKAQATMHRIGLQLIDERGKEVAAEKAASSPGHIDGDRTLEGRDLLTVLIRSNLASEPAQQMSLKEILCQISTFISAGHETTSSALTWCLYALAQCPRAQHRLRAALSTLEPHSATLGEDLARVRYLDWVVRETLRVHAPVTSTMRVAARDDEIPVGRHFVDRHGVARTCIRVKRHDIISIPIQAVNKSKAIWGADAQVFRPERWESPPEEAKAVPGLYSNTLTFLNGNPLNGNRACIGYKFALAEIKIFLYVLLRDIEFAIDPAIVVEKKVNVVTRPFVKSEPHLGNQMPLFIRPVVHPLEPSSPPLSKTPPPLYASPTSSPV
ncbi:hypothetical protein PLICRDRAFT_113427 [Plicaturopsis crispa FD-325 SS-3]|nr:hypothetical protein PLICRDRAFT_113427 [Plicaturopsis crispa FD-325 SS-3]